MVLMDLMIWFRIYVCLIYWVVKTFDQPTRHPWSRRQFFAPMHRAPPCLLRLTAPACCHPVVRGQCFQVVKFDRERLIARRLRMFEIQLCMCSRREGQSQRIISLGMLPANVASQVLLFQCLRVVSVSLYCLLFVTPLFKMYVVRLLQISLRLF
jgi:hypothetical protein